MDRLIRPLRDDWSQVPNPSPALESWEKRTSIKIPEDYRSFILRFNGGRIYPLMFDYTIPLDRYPSTKPVTFLDPFYEWGKVEDIWNGAVFDRRNPPGMLVIGADPGGMEVLLSVDGQTFGKIFTWLHSLSAWGEEENNSVWLQAGTFREFVDSLYDNADRDGYAHWHRPGRKHLERPLQF